QAGERSRGGRDGPTHRGRVPPQAMSGDGFAISRPLIWKDQLSSGLSGILDLSVDVDVRVERARTRRNSRGRRRAADEGAASTTSQADMRGLLRRAEPHDTASSGAASV